MVWVAVQFFIAATASRPRDTAQLGHAALGPSWPDGPPVDESPEGLTVDGVTDQRYPVHVLSVDNPLDVWRTLSRTGRHGWRRKSAKPAASKKGSALFFDWCLFIVALSSAMVLHVLFFQFPSSMVLHTLGLAVWLSVGGAYLLALYSRYGIDYSVMWITGYLLEFINMVENIFIFHSITKAMRTPREHARKAVFIIMLCQIVFQTVCFMGLATWLRTMKALPYIVGIWLLYVGYLVCFSEDELEYDMLDNCFVQVLHKFLGRRFSPVYDEDGSVFLFKDGTLILSMLGLVVFVLILLDGLLEVDVALTKIEEIPNQHLSHTSSVLASLVLPELFFVAGELVGRVSTLRFGVGAVTAFFGVQMLASDLFVVPAAASCLFMLAVVLACAAAAALQPSSTAGVPAEREAMGSAGEGGASVPEAAPHGAG